MGQAVPSNTTRRALFGGALALTAASAAPAVAQSTELQKRQAAFIKQIARTHRDGLEAALHAVSAGMDPDNCIMILLRLRGAEPRMLPALQFKQDGQYRTFRPRGED